MMKVATLATLLLATGVDCFAPQLAGSRSGSSSARRWQQGAVSSRGRGPSLVTRRAQQDDNKGENSLGKTIDVPFAVEETGAKGDPTSSSAADDAKDVTAPSAGDAAVAFSPAVLDKDLPSNPLSRQFGFLKAITT